MTDRETEDARNVALEFETRLHPKPDDGPPLVVLADFSRQLERELEEANRKLSHQQKVNADLLDSVDLLRDELLQANAEIERSAVYQRLREIHQATVDQLTSAKSALEKARDKLDAAQRSMPAFHEGGFYFERHDMDGNYIGSENVDPIFVVQGLDQAVTEALTAINAALEAKP